MLHISIAAETLFAPFGVPVTNALLTTWLVMAALIIFSVLITKNLKRKPGRMQVATELIIGGFFGFFTNLGGKHGKSYAPLAMTIFLFVVISNWSGLLPGVGTVGFFESVEETHAATEEVQVVKSVHAEEKVASEATHEVTTASTEESSTVHEETTAAEESHGSGKIFVPLFRGPTADLNTTLALGLIAFFAIQYYGIKFSGLKYFTKFINIKSPILFFVGILEILSDISKIISFAFRLFGNIFAGEVLLGVMAFLFAFLLPIPFYGLELFVGFIQALVFSMLTTVFIAVAVSHGDHEHAHQATH